MSKDLSADEALSQVASLGAQIDRLPPGDPGRAPLEARRERLRHAAREAADRSRSEAALRHELEGLHSRLTAIEERPIGKGWAEKGAHRWVNDPSAHAHRINEMLAEQDESERAAILARIAQLKELLRA
jgi:hypothetical protein